MKLQRIRKLLVDDFQTLNASLMQKMNKGGSSLVQRIKKITGADALDILISMSQGFSVFSFKIIKLIL